MALSAATGKTYKSLYDVNVRGRGVPSIKTYFTRPFVLLFREPIVMLFALYAGELPASFDRRFRAER
jgi:hypothetical protein